MINATLIDSINFAIALIEIVTGYFLYLLVDPDSGKSRHKVWVYSGYTFFILFYYNARAEGRNVTFDKIIKYVGKCAMEQHLL